MRGLLLLCFDYSKVAIDEFNDWYDTEHIPERERTQGVLNAQRWLDTANRRISVAAYDLESIEVLRSPAYLAIAGPNLSPWSKRVIRSCTQVLRFEGRQLCPGDSLANPDSEFLLLVGSSVAAHQATEIYKEHLTHMAGVPGVVSARVFEGTNDAVKHLELYELSSVDVLKSRDWSEADELHALGGVNARGSLTLLCDRYRRHV